MARRKNLPETVHAKSQIADRLRAIRIELFGERGGSEMARRLALPVRTWYNYESGVTVPAEVILRFVELTSVEPMWLLHGRGPKFRVAPSSPPADSVRDLLRIALQRLENRAGESPRLSAAPAILPIDGGVSLEDGVPAPPFLDADACRPAPGPAYRCVRVEGEAMEPILADGAYALYSEHDEEPDRLDGQLVVAWVDGRPLVRWFERSGHFAILRAENIQAEPAPRVVDLQMPGFGFRLRRVVGTSSPH